jgi:hypothetical protein
MSFVVDKVGLRAIISSLTGLADGEIFWENDPNPFPGEQSRAQVKLKLFGLSTIGIDEHRNAFNPPGYPANSFVTTEIGNREVIISIRVEMYDLSAEAAELCDAIRTGMRAAAVRDRLNAINLALESTTPTKMLPTTYDNRVVSVATFDIQFGGIASQVSQVQAPNTGWIQTVNGNNIVTGTFTE